MSTFRNIKTFSSYSILAEDRGIGKVQDFLFDDVTWTVRYIVVETGSWLASRRVLLSPVAVKSANWETEQFLVNLTSEQVKNSPGIDTAKPVSLQHQIALNDYYAWPYYWTAATFQPVYYPMSIPKLTKNAQQELDKGDPHLRSTNELIKYHIKALDDEIGHVEDFLMDDTSWRIHYMVVDTRNWLPGGKKVLVAPEWITDVSWEEMTVAVNLTTDGVEEAPEYSPDLEMTREYEDQLHEHYSMPKYWQRPPIGGF